MHGRLYQIDTKPITKPLTADDLLYYHASILDEEGWDYIDDLPKSDQEKDWEYFLKEFSPYIEFNEKEKYFTKNDVKVPRGYVEDDWDLFQGDASDGSLTTMSNLLWIAERKPGQKYYIGAVLDYHC